MSAINLKRLPVVAALAFVYASLCAPSAHAGSTTLWYNGDDDGRDALANQTGAADGLIYDDFIIPAGDTYTLTGVFSNDLMYDPAAATTAYWEIRSGVSAVNGGTLVASGDGADTLTATGRGINLGNTVIDEYTNQVAVNVVLTAGTYWLAVAPDVSNQNSYITTTSGANAVGSPPGNDGDSFISSIYFGEYFVPTSDPSVEGSGTWDYSMGIIGTAQSPAAVPEPFGATLLPAAGLILLAYRRRRGTDARAATA
jgi:hypothetical protein